MMMARESELSFAMCILTPYSQHAVSRSRSLSLCQQQQKTLLYNHIRFFKISSSTKIRFRRPDSKVSVRVRRCLYSSLSPNANQNRTGVHTDTVITLQSILVKENKQAIPWMLIHPFTLFSRYPVFAWLPGYSSPVEEKKIPKQRILVIHLTELILSK